MSRYELELKLDLGPGSVAQDVDESARNLREDLLQLDVESVDLVRASKVPKGAKGFGLVSAGALIIKFASSEALGKLVEEIRDWVSRHAGRSAKVGIAGESIELTGLNADQQQQLIDQWIKAVSNKVHG